MNSTSKTIQNYKTILQAAYTEAGKSPLLLTTPYPVNQAGDTTLDMEAKKKATNGMVCLCRMTRSYGERTGRIYDSVYSPYALIIYHNSKTKGADEVRDLLDLSRDALFPHATLLEDEEREIGTDGLFMAWLLFKPLPFESTYTGTTDR